MRERTDDFFMRSMRPHTGAVAPPLSKLQEVSAQLVATAGDGSFGRAGALSVGEVSLTARRSEFIYTRH